jgi:hypothetical protein
MGFISSRPSSNRRLNRGKDGIYSFWINHRKMMKLTSITSPS